MYVFTVRLADADRDVYESLNRKLGLIGEKTGALPEVQSFEVLLEAPHDGRAMEFQVRDHLARQEEARCSVHYVENALINSLFGLLCWEAIFAPIPGAFFHDFQYGPADLESPYFYERRRERFAECFAELESGCYKDIIPAASPCQGGDSSAVRCVGTIEAAAAGQLAALLSGAAPAAVV
jgi:hypothetical protein